MKKLQDYISKRTQLRAKLERFSKFIDDFSPGSDNFFELGERMDNIKEILTDFEDVQCSIELLSKSQDVVREEFENRYFEVVGKAKALQSISRDQTADCSRHDEEIVPSPSRQLAQLPKIQLPIFDGRYEEFPSFKDTFNSLIDSRQDLPLIQRFHYLKSSLRGEALELISSLEVTCNNYNPAWQMLTNRYDNKRLVVTQHIKAIFEVERCEKESAPRLRHLVDSIQKRLKSLESLGLPIESWDAMLVYVISQKLDNQTLKEWEASCSKSEIPTVKQIIAFLEKKAETLESFHAERSIHTSGNIAHNNQQKQRRVVHLAAQHETSCPLCSSSHRLYACKKFHGLDVDRRREIIKTHGLCFNCLRGGHRVSDCSSGPCKLCHQRHNTMLHISSNKEKVSRTEAVSLQSTTDSSSTVLLATAVINVKDKHGNSVICRALLDNGSQSSFIRESFARRLGLPTTRAHCDVTGIGGETSGPFKGVKCRISSRFDGYSAELDCLLLSQITQSLPTSTIDTSQWHIPHSLFLADPSFNKQGPIDMLIGASEFFKVLSERKIDLGPGLPSLILTRLGWIVGGAVSKVVTKREGENVIVCACSVNLERTVQKFWEVENCSEKRELTLEERSCEDLFVRTTTREPDGRFRVVLPKGINFSDLGDSQSSAIRRFINLEKRLNKNPEIKTAYSQFMEEYEFLGHMSEESRDDSSAVNYYLPHHCVINEASRTTKLRVVFDASARTSSGLSLNDVLKVGPSIQDELLSIIMRFREHKVVATADIQKMYRQILVSEEDSQLQRILWRSSPEDSLKTFFLKTVTYGTGPASFLATRCLKQLAIENQATLPKGAEVVGRDFNVDDMLTGADSVEELSSILGQVEEILKQGCFPLHKWCTNSPESLRKITIGKQENTFVPKSDFDSAVKTLGLWWNPQADTFRFNIKLKESPELTKRDILSEVAKIFDPLGLVGPVICHAKIFIQRLWEYKVGWDEPLPEDLIRQWTLFRDQLPSLQRHEIPRLVISNSARPLEIHGFCDASEKAYGAAFYVRTVEDMVSNVRLLCSKSRVSPIKKVTLPRLELCAAVLLARLYNKLKLTKTYKRSILWSDSTIVLAWIGSSSSKWKTFVSNRVAEVQELTAGCQWRHVSSQDNPADLLSRGCHPEEIKSHSQWWNGPQWLSQTEEFWPEHPISYQQPPEMKVSLVATRFVPTIDFDRFSNFNRLIRSTAYALRFIHNIRKESKHIGDLSKEELQVAIQVLIKFVQQEFFEEEINCLKTNLEIPKQSKLKPLNPFLDEDGVLRVGGRISKAFDIPDRKHQILLPDKHRFTMLLAEGEHLKTLHSGPQLLLASLRQRYWPTNGRNFVRMITRKCIRCFKCQPKNAQAIMGELPRERLEATRAFINTGVDFCGPINIKLNNRRGTRSQKAYIAIFICLATKAIHLELTTDLTSECFIAAFKRFISRRGKPAQMWSDNGRNLVGAHKKLHEAFLSATKTPSVQTFIAAEEVSWRFIPPQAPNFGGLWEAAVKSFKYHFKRVVGDALLSFEECYTYLTLVEAVLNSRPVTPLSSDPNDLNPLTPGHFLVGGALTGLPEPDLTDTPLPRLKRWQRVQQLLQHFWSRWSKEYIPSLQPRAKWRSNTPNLSTGQLVLIKEDNLAPLCWRVGRITEVHPGSDGVVRVCTVKTLQGTYKRPASKLFPLPLNEL